MDTLKQALKELRALNIPVPKPMSLPSELEVANSERDLSTKFHPDFRTFLLNASDIVLGTIEPATITIPESHTHLPKVIESARGYGVPESLFPFCENNADFYCLSDSGEVVFWSHNGPVNERWPNLASWILDVWIGESS